MFIEDNSEAGGFRCNSCFYIFQHLHKLGASKLASSPLHIYSLVSTVASHVVKSHNLQALSSGCIKRPVLTTVMLHLLLYVLCNNLEKYLFINEH